MGGCLGKGETLSNPDIDEHTHNLPPTTTQSTTLTITHAHVTQSTTQKDTITPTTTQSTKHKDTIPPTTTQSTTHKDTIPPTTTQSTIHKDTIPPIATQSPHSGKNVALLVGCNYASRKHDQWTKLRGCHNDVNAVSATLIGVFGFEPEDIEVLVDKPGTKLQAMPTGANIKSALQRLISQLREGDVLFFHFSGHGTRVPSAEYPGKLVEAIVPCDGNLITNMDFRKLVDRVPQDATFLFFSDSCHSGGLIDKEKEQIGPNTSSRSGTVQPDSRRFIPYEAVKACLQDPNNMSHDIETIMVRTFESDASLLFRQTRSQLPAPLKPGQGILLSACQSDEQAAEYLNHKGHYFGQFTSAVQVIIRENLLAQPFSNKQLVMKAREIIPTRVLQSQNSGDPYQHPCLYCSEDNANRTFLYNRKKRSIS